jgi:hypothetical protein
MPDGAKTNKTARTQAEMRQERLAAELRANLVKRKQQARSRAAAADRADKEDSGPSGGR